MTLDLEPIKTRLSAATTPCAWCDAPATGYAFQFGDGTYPNPSCGEVNHGYRWGAHPAFDLPSFRDDIPALIAEVERLRAGRAS